MGWRVLLVLLVSAESSTALAETFECVPNPHLRRAQREYDALQFGRAQRTVQRAVESARNCRAELAEIYRLQGFIRAVQGDTTRCQRDFEIMLALDPDFSMSADVPPKIRGCFEKAQSVAPSRRTLALTHQSPGEVPPDTVVPLSVRLVDPLRVVNEVEVYFRRAGVESYTPIATPAQDRVTLAIPALAVAGAEEAYQVEYFLRGVDPWKGALVELGRPGDPLRLTVQAKRGRALVSRWWFWAITGAAIAGGVTAGVLIADGGSDDLDIGFRLGGR